MLTGHVLTWHPQAFTSSSFSDLFFFKKQQKYLNDRCFFSRGNWRTQVHST